MTVRPFNGDTTPMINDLGDGTHRAVLDAATSGPVNLRPFSGDTTPQINDLGDGVHREVVEIVGEFGDSTPGLTIDAAPTVTNPGDGDFVPISNNGEAAKVAMGYFLPRASAARLPPRTGRWLADGSGSTSGANMELSGRIYYVPIIITQECTVDRIGIHVHQGAASTSARLGIYGSTADGLPGNLLRQCAALVSTATAGALEGTFTVNPVLTPGLYFLAWQSNSGGFTLQPRVITESARWWLENGRAPTNVVGTSNLSCFENGNFTTGLPATATPVFTGNLAPPAIAVRVL